MNATLPKPTLPGPFDIAVSIAPALKPMALAAGRNEQLRRSVIDRVRRSALAHRDFTTVRCAGATGTVTSPGVRHCALSADGGMRVDVLTVAPAATIPWPQEAQAQEILVVDGTLSVGVEASAATALSPMQQLVVGRAAAWRQTAGIAGATLYVRSRLVGLEQLATDEAQWWVASQGASPSAAMLDCTWSQYLEGVKAAVLRAHGDVASMLVKIAPGAALPDHGHRLDEDCFMLDGDMFLGDVLMRAGDYQRAPMGCQHVGISSDTGGLFYFHGAIPPSASEQAP